MSQETLSSTPERIEDPEKAHVMALAGDPYRTIAAKARKESAKGNTVYEGPVSQVMWAEVNDSLAQPREEDAGSHHDRVEELKKSSSEV